MQQSTALQRPRHDRP